MPAPDLALYAGREQAYVKHYLLEKYLTDWGYKVGSEWDGLVYVDGFAGPWGVTDPNCADSSFGIATDTLRRVASGLKERGRSLATRAILVEKSTKAYPELAAFGTARRAAGEDVQTIRGEFVANVPEIDRLIRATGANPFKFFLLDPKGWKDIPMSTLGSLLRDRSCEVLVNLMTSDITRFLNEESRANSYKALFGREEVLEVLRQIPKGTREQAECAVKEYCRSLKQICGFEYVSQAVVLEPNAEAIRYFLIYATHHHTGVEVFKSAEMKAAKIQDEARSEAAVRKTRQGTLDFGDGFNRTPVVHELRAKYVQRARTKILEILRTLRRPKLSYRDLYCEAMAFPLVTRYDLNNWLADMAHAVSIELADTRRRTPSLDHDDFVVVQRADALPAE